MKVLCLDCEMVTPDIEKCENCEGINLMTFYSEIEVEEEISNRLEKRVEDMDKLIEICDKLVDNSTLDYNTPFGNSRPQYTRHFIKISLSSWKQFITSLKKIKEQ